jgi:formate dehydrogenase subunit delta
MSELDQLIKMANQIAANFAYHGDRADRIATHINRFWAPVMRQQLKDHASKGASDLDQAVLLSLDKITTG